MTAVIPRIRPLALPQVVIDNPASAWDYSTRSAIGALDSDFARTYSDLLDEAAYDLIRPFLAAAWREHGLTVRFPDGTFRADRGNEVEPDNETYWAVWQTAADQIATEALLERAGFPADYLRA